MIIEQCGNFFKPICKFQFDLYSGKQTLPCSIFILYTVRIGNKIVTNFLKNQPGKKNPAPLGRYPV